MVGLFDMVRSLFSVSSVSKLTLSLPGPRTTRSPRLARHPQTVRFDRLIDGRHAVPRVGVPRAGTGRSRGKYQRDGEERFERRRHEVCAAEW